jgi:predicted ABC-type ATPase
MPNVVILAGPNGAGKSTLAPALVQRLLGVEEFVNADAIAQGLSGFNPEGAAMEAGRMMLMRLRGLAARREDFAFETTLASRVFAPWVRGLRSEGYRFHLSYVWVSSADICIARVARRVQAGGHSIPEDVIRRRYVGSLRNFFELYQPLADSWQVYDNVTGRVVRVVAEGEGSSTLKVHDAQTWDDMLRRHHGPE